jgi:acyl dehydratase
MAGKHGAAGMSEPRYWDDYEVGQKFPLGSTTFTEQEIVDFARQFDPQPFHVDAARPLSRCMAA